MNQKKSIAIHPIHPKKRQASMITIAATQSIQLIPIIPVHDN